MPLTVSERRLVKSIAETLFPRGGAIDADAQDAHVAAWVEDYLDRLPTLDAAKLRAFFQLFATGYGTRLSHLGRSFVDAHIDERTEYLDSWEHSSSYTQRMGWQGLRMVFTMAYAASPVVREAMGEFDAIEPSGPSTEAPGLRRIK